MSDRPKPFTPGKIDITASVLPAWENDPRRYADIMEGAIMVVAGRSIFRLTNGKWEKVRDAPPTEETPMSAVTIYDLAGLRSLRDVEQRSWEMTPDAHRWPKTSPWAEDWDNYIADATVLRLDLFVVLSCFDFDEDINDVLRGLEIHGTYMVGNVDGDDIVGFSDERDRQTLLEWCHSTTARQSPT